MLITNISRRFLGNTLEIKLILWKINAFYSKNNFSSPNYKYIGNPKEKENFNFLSFTIKDILLYGKDNIKQNRQYNNETIIKFVENNEFRTKDKIAYKELINFLNEKIENVFINFYDDKKELEKINKDIKYINFDEYYKRETGISLLENYGFLKVLKNKYKSAYINQIKKP